MLQQRQAPEPNTPQLLNVVSSACGKFATVLQGAVSWRLLLLLNAQQPCWSCCRAHGSCCCCSYGLLLLLLYLASLAFCSFST